MQNSKSKQITFPLFVPLPTLKYILEQEFKYFLTFTVKMRIYEIYLANLDAT